MFAYTADAADQQWATVIADGAALTTAQFNSVNTSVITPLYNAWAGLGGLSFDPTVDVSKVTDAITGVTGTPTAIVPTDLRAIKKDKPTGTKKFTVSVQPLVKVGAAETVAGYDKFGPLGQAELAGKAVKYDGTTQKAAYLQAIDDAIANVNAL